MEASASTGRAQHGARVVGSTRCMALATRLGAQLPLPSLAAALPAAADVRCELLSSPLSATRGSMPLASTMATWLSG